jgi:ribonuclease P protein component
VIGRLLRSADFDRVLRTRDVARSVHFAVHHVAGRPVGGSRVVKRPADTELSTAVDDCVEMSVDDLSPTKASTGVPVGPAVWLGAVVPKRHAKRAVTRNLLKRQIRAVLGDHQHELAHGLWIVRLRAPIEASYSSAASATLRDAVRGELRRVLGSALRARRPALA